MTLFHRNGSNPCSNSAPQRASTHCSSDFTGDQIYGSAKRLKFTLPNQNYPQPSIGVSFFWFECLFGCFELCFDPDSRWPVCLLDFAWVDLRLKSMELEDLKTERVEACELHPDVVEWCPASGLEDWLAWGMYPD